MQVVAQRPSYVAPPMTTMAAPMMTTGTPMYGGAQQYGNTTMAAPFATPMMAPRTPSYVAPPMQAVVQRPSYVAPPMMTGPMMTAPAVLPGTMALSAGTMSLPANIPMPQPPGAPPQRLTAGIPDPAQIETQKVAYAAGLDRQLNDAIATVQNETRIEKEMVAFKTQKDVAMFEAQMDEQLVEQLAMADERAAMATCQLKKAAVERNLALNNQASSLVMDYNMKVMIDDIAARKRAFEQQYVQKEVKLAQDFNRTAGQAGAVPMPMYAAPPNMYGAPPPNMMYGAPPPNIYAAPPTVVV